MQTRLYIDGEFVDGLAGRTLDVVNPADASVLASVAEAGPRMWTVPLRLPSGHSPAGLPVRLLEQVEAALPQLAARPVI